MAISGSWEIVGPTVAQGVADETARVSTWFTVLGFKDGPSLSNG
jgi:hypothetical protein